VVANYLHIPAVGAFDPPKLENTGLVVIRVWCVSTMGKLEVLEDDADTSAIYFRQLWFRQSFKVCRSWQGQTCQDCKKDERFQNSPLPRSMYSER